MVGIPCKETRMWGPTRDRWKGEYFQEEISSPGNPHVITLTMSLLGNWVPGSETGILPSWATVQASGGKAAFRGQKLLLPRLGRRHQRAVHRESDSSMEDHLQPWHPRTVSDSLWEASDHQIPICYEQHSLQTGTPPTAACDVNHSVVRLLWPTSRIAGQWAQPL